MTVSKIIFFVLGGAIIVFSVLSITSRKILRAAIYLLFVMVSIAGLFYMMHFSFLAAVQLILYAGGIVVLIIFSILLTSQINDRLEPPKIKNLLGGVLTAGGGLTLSALIILPFSFLRTDNVPLTVDMRTIGHQLLNVHEQGYALPFEVISILLLAALVGAIFIAKRTL